MDSKYQKKLLDDVNNNDGFAGLATSQPKSEAKQTDDETDKPEAIAITNAEMQMVEQTVIDFIESDEPCKDLKGLTNLQFKEIHLYAKNQGVKSRSRSCGGHRILTLIRTECFQPYVRLKPARWSVSSQFFHRMKGLMTNLRKRTFCPPSELFRSSSPQVGGLVSLPRIPPKANSIDDALDNERRQLPIFEKRQQILDLLDMSQVLIINGATGSGKSTQLPQYLLEQATASEQPIRIVVSQPRRIAASSVSKRIAEERGEELGDTVGYVIRMDSKYSENTVLAFTTSGCLLRSLAINGVDLINCSTHLIVDEVHDRNLNADFLLLAIKLELERNKTLKLILMSATMDLDKLSAYFGNAPVLDVEGRGFNVSIYPLERILAMTGYMTPDMRTMLNGKVNANKDQLLDAYLRAHRTQTHDIDNTLIASLLEMLLRKGVKGAAIVFLPGYQDMMRLMDKLIQCLDADLVTIQLLHSQIDGQKQKEVFCEYPDVQLKIVLSTNIAQTSITIPDLVYVIDTGLGKMMTYDSVTGASQLVCDWISQADAQQRTGRAGRCNDGICYRLYSTKQFNSFSPFAVPEIMRYTLDDICLLAKLAVPHQPIEQFLSLALDPPETVAVTQALNKLKLLQVLNVADESVTQLGHIIAELPLDVQFGKSVVYGLYYCCLGSLSIIAAFYSVRDPFVLPIDRDCRGAQRSKRISFSSESLSDSLGILKLYKKFRAASKSGDADEIESFCEYNFLSRQSMETFVSAVHSLRIAMRRIFKIKNISSVTKYDNNMNTVRLALTAGLYPKLVYIDRSNMYHRNLIAEGDPSIQISRNSCLNYYYSKKPRALLSDWILYVEKTCFGGRSSNIEHATLVSTFMVALQCGKVAKLEPYFPDYDWKAPDDSPREMKPVFDSVLCIDSWVRILVDTELAKQILELRSHISNEFNALLSCRSVSENRSATVEIVQKLLDINALDSGLGTNDIDLS